MAPKIIFTEKDDSPMKFYLAMSVPDRTNLAKEIEEHGGCIVDRASDGYFLVNPNKPLQKQVCYDFSFITKSIKEGSLLDMNFFHLKGPIGPKSGRTPFTEEDNKILLEMVDPTRHAKGNAIYKQIEKEHPHHPWSSWRDHYVKNYLTITQKSNPKSDQKSEPRSEPDTARPVIPRYFQPESEQEKNIASAKAAKKPTPNRNNRQLQWDQDDGYFEGNDDEEGETSSKNLSRQNVHRQAVADGDRQEDTDEEDRKMDHYLLNKVTPSKRPGKFLSPLKGETLREKSGPVLGEDQEDSVVENQRDSGVGIDVDVPFTSSRTHSFRFEERRAPSPEDRASRHSSEWGRSRISRKRKIFDEEEDDESEELEKKSQYSNKSRRLENASNAENTIIIPDDLEQENQQGAVLVSERQARPQRFKSNSERIITEVPESSQFYSQFPDYDKEPDDKLEKQLTAVIKSNKKQSVSQPDTAASLNTPLHLNQSKHADVEPLYQRALTTRKTLLEPNTSVKDSKRSDSNSSNKYEDQKVFLGLLKGLTVDFKVDLSKAIEICEECNGDFELAREILSKNYGRREDKLLLRKHDFDDKMKARVDVPERNNSRRIPWTNEEDKTALGIDSNAITQLKKSRGANEVMERTKFLRKTLR